MFRKLILKDRLMNAFRTGELCYSTQRNGRTLRKFPNVIDVRPDKGDGKTVFVFRLPPGLNPSEIKKKEYVFYSYFGDNLELKGDKGIYSLTIYSEGLEKDFAYSFDTFEKAMSKCKLPIMVGKDIHGKIHVYDMLKNPHLLIAGETGSGKSVMLRSIISSLIIHKRTGLELYLADLKRSEFHVFRHVDTVKAVMTKKEQVKQCLWYLQKEMSDRGDLLDLHEVEHIDEYNKLDKEKKPYILLCIDEYAQLKKDKDITEIVDEIGRIGRALGVFLILSMQRPDAKVLEGGLKANLTVQFGFRTLNRLNSSIVLGNVPEDCSKIKEDEPGKFYYSNGSITLMQGPYLPMSDEKKNDGTVITGVKTLLEPYKERKYEPSERETVADVEYKEEDAHTEDFAPLLMLEEGEDERTRQGDN